MKDLVDQYTGGSCLSVRGAPSNGLLQLYGSGVGWGERWGKAQNGKILNTESERRRMSLSLILHKRVGWGGVSVEESHR